MQNQFTSYGYNCNVNHNIQFNGDYIIVGNNKSNLILMGHGVRLYNPSLRRTYNADSYSYLKAKSINPYAFVNNDPINHNDPSGHMPKKQPNKGFLGRFKQSVDNIVQDKGNARDKLFVALDSTRNLAKHGKEAFMKPETRSTNLQIISEEIDKFKDATTGINKAHQRPLPASKSTSPIIDPERAEESAITNSPQQQPSSSGIQDIARVQPLTDQELAEQNIEELLNQVMQKQ